MGRPPRCHFASAIHGCVCPNIKTYYVFIYLHCNEESKYISLSEKTSSNVHGYNADCFSEFLINETRLPTIFRNSFWATKICGSEILEVSESQICYHVTATPEKTERSKFEYYSESYLLLRIFQYLDLKGISGIHLSDKKTSKRRGKRAPLSDKEESYVKSELLFHKKL